MSFKTIATDLKGTTAIQAFWCGTSFLLTSTVFQPSWASFSHIIGRKSVLLTALLLFTIGTIVASVAKSISTLLVGRCVQGIGGGGLVGLTYVVVSDMVTLRERGKWFSVISLQWAIGSVLGPVIGGSFAEHTTWRWIFWLNIPFCVFAAIGIPVCLRLTPREGSALERLKHFDWFGSFIFVAATTSFLIPLTWVSLYESRLGSNVLTVNTGRCHVRMAELENPCASPSWHLWLDRFPGLFRLLVARTSHSPKSVQHLNFDRCIFRNTYPRHNSLEFAVLYATLF